MKLENSNFTIYEVEEIKTILEKELQNNQKIIVDLENVQKIDMSAIQLIISLKITSKENGKIFQLLNVNDEIMNSLNISGTTYACGA